MKALTPAMTPRQFASRMKRIEKEHTKDPEVMHSEADKLMCEALKGQGFVKGIEVFERMKLFYS